MSEKVVFQQEPNGYSPIQVDAYFELLLGNYEELLAHYQQQQAELEQLKQELAQKDATPSTPDYAEEALELLTETTQVITNARSQARNKITAFVDQVSLHTRRLDDALQVMKDEIDRMYGFVDKQL